MEKNIENELTNEEKDYIEKYLAGELNEEMPFDGKLTEEELQRLRDADFSEKQIQIICDFVEEYKEYLSGFSDLVGDDLVPSNMFCFNIEHIGKLLDGDPDNVLSKLGVKLRGLSTAKLVKLLGENFMTSKQVFENRNELLNKKDENGKYILDNGIVLPKEPVIWASNHHFKDDALASVRAAQRPVYIMFGSIPLYFNTFDGVLAFLIGSILINRKVKKSKQAAIPKANKAIDYGADLLWYPEATHNKTANELILDIWNGIYRVANEKGTKVVPAVHYIFDPTQKILPHELNPIHTVVDDPIDLTQFSEKAGLEYFKEVLSTWYYLMLEKYGKMSREELFEAYKKRASFYGVSEEELRTHPLTSAEIGELYNLDLRSTVNGYDKAIEVMSNFENKSIIKPEKAFADIANIKNTNPENVLEVIQASKLVRERKYENYQKRF